MRDLGFMIDSQMSFAQHVNSIACKCYSELHRIKSFCRSLPTDAALTIEQFGSFKNRLLKLPTSGDAGTSRVQTSICHECHSHDYMQSQKIQPHHKPPAGLPTQAARSATGDVQVMSTRILISPRVCSAVHQTI